MNAPTLPDWLTTVTPMTLAFSIIPDVSGQSILLQGMPWPELANMLANPPTYPSKHYCPLIKLATFGTTRTAAKSLRHDGNVLTVTGIEGDYDAEQVPMAEAVARARAAGIAAVFYTSASHTPAAPRWRVVCPLSAPAAPDKREGLLACVDALLGDILASESYTLSQTYFYGRVAGAPFESVVVDGVPFDTVLPAADRARRQTKAKGPTKTLPLPDDFAEVLENIPARCRGTRTTTRRCGCRPYWVRSIRSARRRSRAWSSGRCRGIRQNTRSALPRWCRPSPPTTSASGSRARARQRGRVFVNVLACPV